MVLPRLKEMNRDMVNAAYDLGATRGTDVEGNHASFI